MKVLFISALLPYPLHSGGQVRIYNLLKAAAKTHEITLLSYIRNNSEKKYLEKLNFVKTAEVFMRGRALQMKYLIPSIFGKLPLLMESYVNRAMSERIAELMEKEKFDLIHLEPFYVYPVIPKNLNTPIVVSEHNIEYQVYADHADTYGNIIVKQLLKTDGLKLKKYERQIWRDADRIVAVSTEDAGVIKEYLHQDKTDVVANGVDLVKFKYHKRMINTDEPKFLFVGNFLWMPNTEAVKKLIYQIWPEIQKILPRAKMRIVGKHIPDKLNSDLTRAGIEYREKVTNIEDEYANADMMLAPLGIGGGSKFKILEAMASGLPVITTHEGVQGLDVREGTDYLAAASTEDYILQIKRIIGDKNLGVKLSRSARSIIENKYSWENIGSEFIKVWKNTYEKYKS